MAGVAFGIDAAGLAGLDIAENSPIGGANDRRGRTSIPLESELFPFASINKLFFALAVGLTVVVTACSQTPVEAPSRADRMAEVIALGQSDAVAACVVGLLEDFQSNLTVPNDSQPALDLDAPQVQEALESCQQASDLLAAELAPPEDLAFDPGPLNYGDDRVLDALWDSCEAGEGEACDELWSTAPIGSAYEAYGVTCGERFEVLDCAAEMAAEEPDSDQFVPQGPTTES